MKRNTLLLAWYNGKVVDLRLFKLNLPIIPPLGDVNIYVAQTNVQNSFIGSLIKEEDIQSNDT